jgi:hypothetical protein
MRGVDVDMNVVLAIYIWKYVETELKLFAEVVIPLEDL